MQRGEPESVMLKIQNYHGGGVLSSLVEHAGDIIHRMNEAVAINNSEIGRHSVLDKCDKSLSSLNHEYGFEKEHEENMIANSKYRKRSFKEHRQTLTELLNEYSKAHAALPVYNRLQWLARESTISIGNQKFKKAAKLIKEIFDIASDKNFYENTMSVCIKNWKPK